ncbi:hypothetical protein IC229_10840 [Spirosoma sp. BT702]|uniref:Uncharacterized protein n=1 Tax=Spirosoma profusum TaxID=2771354 RepID=A0A926Y091_9BACT|nr:hypothetical protein [Spirosoma profusum]MBD2701133.1 hypothetical protein [Spirosoma profusum]
MAKSKLTIICLFIQCLACSQADRSNPQETVLASPLEGSWELVENRVKGELVMPQRYPQQFKIFHDGFFSYLMYKPDGSFYNAGAGTYLVEGNRFKEKFLYYSDTVYVGSSDWQEWKLEGDTLYFYGFSRRSTKVAGMLHRSGDKISSWKNEFGLDVICSRRLWHV